MPSRRDDRPRAASIPPITTPANILLDRLFGAHCVTLDWRADRNAVIGCLIRKERFAASDNVLFWPARRTGRCSGD